jgi:NAD(P)-dependent dehydrogenase (short-subunit alcohol dehydrogenase family)
MYTTSAIAPVFIVHRLVHANLMGKGSKVILVTSESGSLTLRHEAEGGGNYGHHASKAAENMVGKLLSLDLKDKGIIVTMVHPGFMRTEMTKSVGFDKFYDEGGGKSSVFRASSEGTTLNPQQRSHRTRQLRLCGSSLARSTCPNLERTGHPEVVVILAPLKWCSGRTSQLRSNFRGKPVLFCL